jgi:hypothetical protein
VTVAVENAVPNGIIADDRESHSGATEGLNAFRCSVGHASNAAVMRIVTAPWPTTARMQIV